MADLKHWEVTAHGDTVYVRAPNKAKAVEVVEAEFGIPPGAITMDVEPIQAEDLPAGERWLK
jgi:hypothetical protein